MLKDLAARYKEAQCEPISRMVGKLRNLRHTVKREFGKGVQTPNWIWDWLLNPIGDLANEGEFAQITS